MSAGHVGVSISAEMRSPNKREKQTQYKCLSSSLARIRSQEDKGTSPAAPFVTAVLPNQKGAHNSSMMMMYLFPSERTGAAEVSSDPPSG